MRIHNKFLVTPALALMMGGIALYADHAVTTEDKAFINEALKGGQKEVQMAQLGANRATSANVKQLAQTIIADHSKANQELMALAKKKGVALPAEKPQVVPDQGMSARTGNDFDRAFAQAMVDDHKTDITAFEKAAQSANDADLRAWASAKLPTLRMHLESARKLAK